MEELDYAYDFATKQAETEFTIIPVHLENCDRGDHRLSIYQHFDLFEDWDGVLNQLAVQLGGYSLADKQATDERTEDEKMIERLHSRAYTLYQAGEYIKALQTWDVIAELEQEILA